MANSRGLPETTAFTKAFSSALRQVMTARGVTQTRVAEEIDRDQTFVSERTSGKRPCDTDIIAGVAKVARVEPRTIVSEVMREMRRLQVVRAEPATTKQPPSTSRPPAQRGRKR